LLSTLGRHRDALEAIRQARALDPVSLSVQTAYGAFLFRAGEGDAAREQLAWVTARDSAFANAYALLAEVCVYLGRNAEAGRAAETCARLTDRSGFSLATLGYVRACTNDVQAAEHILAELLAKKVQGLASPFDIATVLKGMGRIDEAFVYFDEAFRMRDVQLISFAVEPSNKVLRGDRRFRELIGKMGLPTAAFV
jgi:Flp pilus assembly protein TadD